MTSERIKQNAENRRNIKHILNDCRNYPGASIDGLADRIIHVNSVHLKLITEDTEEQDHCPKCHSIDIVDHSEFGLPLGRDRMCGRCSHTWKEKF